MSSIAHALPSAPAGRLAREAADPGAGSGGTAECGGEHRRENEPAFRFLSQRARVSAEDARREGKRTRNAMEKGATRGEETGGRRVSRCARWIAGSVGGLSSAPGPRARRGPFPRSGARRAGRLPAIDGFAASFSFLARKWHIAARWGRRRDRRRRTACSPEDASGKAPHAFDEKRRTGAHLGSGRRVRGCGARTARAREHVPSEEATDRYTDRKYAKNHSLALQSWQSQDLARGSGLFASLPAPHDRGDTGVPRRGTAYAKHFAWPPPARARRETHRGSSRLADG